MQRLSPNCALLLWIAAIVIALPAAADQLDPRSNRPSLGRNVNIEIFDGRVSPSAVRIQPGTTLVWFNRSGGNVRLHFKDQAIATTCKAPLGFNADLKGIRTSTALKDGQLASVCLLEPSDYTYEIEQVGLNGKAPVIGKVEVSGR